MYMKKYNGLKRFKENETSPFIEDLYELNISTRRKILAGNNGSTNSLIVNPDTGEVEGNQVFAIQEKVDREAFTKIYSGMMREMFKLSTRAIKVFGYITSIAKPNKDSVLFDLEEAMKYTDYKGKKSVYEGLEELIENNIIARTNRHYKYFINPNLFFNGNRLTLIKQYVKEGNNTIEKQSLIS